MELPDEDQKSSVAFTEGRVTQLTQGGAYFNGDAKSVYSIMEEDSVSSANRMSSPEMNQSITKKVDRIRNKINLAGEEMKKQSLSLKHLHSLPPISLIKPSPPPKLGGLISRTRSQLQFKQEDLPL